MQLMICNVQIFFSVAYELIKYNKNPRMKT